MTIKNINSLIIELVMFDFELLANNIKFIEQNLILK